MNDPKPILAVLHQAHSTPGKVGERLAARGHDIEECRPMLGEPLPADLDRYAGLVVFGGPQSANDDHLAGIRAELEWLDRHAIPSGRPLLGICLGAQQIARVLGGRVSRREDGLVEIGYWPVAPTPAADGFLAATTSFYQWHAETFEIPGGATHLAGSDAFPAQAFGYGERVFGIEFHPEMTLEMIDRWCTSDTGAPKLAWAGAQSHAEQREGYRRHAAESDRWLEEFLRRWLASG